MLKMQVPVPTVLELRPLPELFLHWYRHQGSQTEAPCSGMLGNSLYPLIRSTLLEHFRVTVSVVDKFFHCSLLFKKMYLMLYLHVFPEKSCTTFCNNL